MVLVRVVRKKSLSFCGKKTRNSSIKKTALVLTIQTIDLLIYLFYLKILISISFRSGEEQAFIMLVSVVTKKSLNLCGKKTKKSSIKKTKLVLTIQTIDLLIYLFYLKILISISLRTEEQAFIMLVRVVTKKLLNLCGKKTRKSSIKKTALVLTIQQFIYLFYLKILISLSLRTEEQAFILLAGVVRKKSLNFCGKNTRKSSIKKTKLVLTIQTIDLFIY